MKDLFLSSFERVFAASFGFSPSAGLVATASYSGTAVFVSLVSISFEFWFVATTCGALAFFSLIRLLFQAFLRTIAKNSNKRII